MIAAALSRACDFLAARQDADGFWRDYELPPGASDDWVTAFVGHALTGVDAQPDAVARGIDALRSCCRATGWGYNAAVATDADTTSWVVRWFARTRTPLPLDASACLASYLGPGGGARTFACGPRYGRWTIEHVDVTAVLGLAIAEAGLRAPASGPIRKWVLAQRNDVGLWSSFWWTFDAYAIARVLELLHATEGIPSDVERDARLFLRQHAGPATAMEAANLLMIARAVEGPADRWLKCLLEMQRTDGGWPPSRALKVPHQHHDGKDEPSFADSNRLMSTAMSVMALRSASS